MLNILPSNPNTNIKLETDILCNDTTNWTNWTTSAPANTTTPIGDMLSPYPVPSMAMGIPYLDYTSMMKAALILACLE